MQRTLVAEQDKHRCKPSPRAARGTLAYCNMGKVGVRSAAGGWECQESRLGVVAIRIVDLSFLGRSWSKAVLQESGDRAVRWLKTRATGNVTTLPEI